MSTMMAMGWLPALVAVSLVIGGVVLVAWLVKPQPAGVGNMILSVLAVIGGIALVAIVAMSTMHFGMSCCR